MLRIAGMIATGTHVGGLISVLDPSQWGERVWACAYI